VAIVKGRRPHQDQRGQARTRLARRAVIEAARALFLDRGYAATTIDAISDRSDVPPATIYRLFSSKLGILKALGDLSIAGDDEAIPVQDRPDVAALFAEPDPRKMLAGFARINVAISTRTERVYRILVSAAASDPEAAALLTHYHRQRDQGQGQIARALARAGALQPGLLERDAADIVHALMSPDLYRLLVTERDWAPERYERWLAATLIGQLLPPPTRGTPAGRPYPSAERPSTHSRTAGPTDVLHPANPTAKSAAARSRRTSSSGRRPS
jgi:AcrR family transcriptional regulator